MAEAESVRPAWTFDGIAEADARWLLSGKIERIAHGWKFVSEDRTDWWVTFTRSDGQTKQISGHKLQGNQLFQFAANSTGLECFRPYWAEQMRATLAKIDAWERQNAADRTEYERLKKKFELGAA